MTRGPVRRTGKHASSNGRNRHGCCIPTMGLRSAVHPREGVCDAWVASDFDEMTKALLRRIVGLLGIICILALSAAAQQDRGELRIELRDPQGASLVGQGELVSVGNQFRLNFQVGEDGRYVAKGLAFGVYRVS